MTDKKLEAYQLKSDSDKAFYKEQLKKINSKNPFFKLELLQIDTISGGNLRYFIYYSKGAPVILMNFILRPIPSSTYFDVISPYGYNGPLFKDEIDCEVIADFWAKVDEWYAENNVISEFIRFNLNNNHKKYSGTIVHTLNNVRGTIIDEEAQWANFKPKVRNNYRKAVKNDLTFAIYHKNIDEGVLDSFHDIYTRTMKRNEATDQYFYPKEYFKNYTQNNPKRCAIALIFHDGKPISTELILLSKKTVYSFLGGTLSDYFTLRPNDYLKINILKWARENKYGFYVLGGGRKDGDSLYSYKKTFFSKDDDISYYTGRKIINKEAYYQEVKKNNALAESYSQENIVEGFFPKYRQHEK
ncbi:GNAT family N-acetyltransferase [Flagellimonas sp. HMM57]|uniref:GNAT family N-acetyltransferase n=1 Tax=unclassified Flagellimonas TaxID=2644544 RepID=UPI0013D88EB3|nr:MULTISPECIES: GNAT family N-acetyltransferase [unclassified Flagellimonas]UII76140.1 GNAT family N-acetyltransferase [Flagellimonas sp. HMM57]